MAKKTQPKQIENIAEKYRIIEPLGEGGNAKVFRAKDIASGKEVAIKTLCNLSPEKKIRFADEINIMRNNKDIQGILPIVDYNNDYFWYSMPIATPIFNHSEALYQDTPNYYDRNGKNYKKWMTVLITGFIQLAETLEQLHTRGIHHRDIKPDNIYILEDRYTFGDFGLVEFPDNANNQTRNDKGLGAIFTIAPEMKRNPKDADGGPADVYSLAKTLWIMLSRDEKGFDGQYSWNDKGHGLRYYNHLNDEYLVEIEELLYSSTSNIPEDRPSISQFKDKLNQWLDVYIMPESHEREKREWRFISSRIFGQNISSRTQYNDPTTIVRVLNILAQSHALNHMMIPGGGGLDFSSAELAPEPGFIYIHANEFLYLLKPKTLYFESFKDSRWNYWMIECDTVEPIPNIPIGDCGDQELIEDTPAHYIQGEDSVYGVYDYDLGNPLPKGWKQLSRFTKGNFLIVMKTCTYNHIPATYDGRHSDMTNDEFRKYIEKLQAIIAKCLDRGIKEEVVLSNHHFGEHPYPDRIKRSLPFFNQSTNTLPSAGEFIKANFKNWSFKDILPKDNGEGKLAFRFTFKTEEFADIDEQILLGKQNKTELSLSKDGHITDYGADNLHPFEVYDRKLAIEILKSLNNRLSELCKGYDTDDIDSSVYFDIEWRRIAPPSHIFTEKEIEEAMRSADDRYNNLLVIDEDGYAQVIRPESNNEGELYPVRNSIWCSRNNYVGKYSPLSTLHENYVSSLTCWQLHLKTGRHFYTNSVREEDPLKLMEEISSLMKLE